MLWHKEALTLQFKPCVDLLFFRVVHPQLLQAFDDI